MTNLNVLVNLYFEMHFCTKWNVSYFLCHLFAFHESSSASIKSPPLFVLVFISEFYLFIYLFILMKVQLSHLLRRVQNTNFSSELQQVFPDIYCKKCQYEFCDYYILLFIFIQRWSYKTCQKIIQPKSKFMPTFKWH